MKALLGDTFATKGVADQSEMGPILLSVSQWVETTHRLDSGLSAARIAFMITQPDQKCNLVL